ncbi:MAG: hypothetical protein A2X96_04915 [Syntrophobacterales bacterium GWC2_56_13]|nr:MAG: hypothetical protein A2X96_04915 [Syntrophobacterales bacterium GWC2_56_13]OHE19231.1 MAG: hypothetical protein A2X95_06700 [Syntrophobacterales bacterium GWF2_56_9]
MQDRSMGKAPSIPEVRPADEEILTVKGMIGSFLIALRNYVLYPEDHAMCRKSLAAVQGRLDGFLAGHQSLRLDVEKDRFLFQGEIVHQGPSQEDSLTFQLFREGIQWLEFKNGFTAEELNVFFKLLNQYRTPKEEAEGDLVTALWEADFPHLQYKNEDVLWEAEPLIDFSLLKVAPGEVQPEEEGVEEPVAPAAKIAMPAADAPFWKLTPAEEKEIEAMILEEETRDCTEDVLEVLMIILKEQRDPKDFAVILDFLTEEFRYTLAQGEFSFARKFLESIRVLQESRAPDRPWTRSLLDAFRQRISDSEVLGALEEAWQQVIVMDADRLEELRRSLLLLPAKVILTLGPMLPNVGSPGIEQLLMEVIGAHADDDLDPVKQLLDTAEEPLARRIIHVLKHLPTKDPTDVLFELTRHAQDTVCKDAVNALVDRDPQNLRKLFPLLEDPRLHIRRLICGHLGKRVNPLAEELLLDYLKHRRFQLKDRQHILACYRALGQCGSARSLPFLQESLLKQDWKSFLGIGGSLHRQGGALALLAVRNEEAARSALRKASRSIFSGVRLAYRRAVEEDQKMKKEPGR